MDGAKLARMVEAFDRLRSVRESAGAKDIQLFDIMVLLHFLDGEFHSNSELLRKLEPYKTNPNLVFDATTRLYSRKGLLEREVDPYNAKIFNHKLTKKGRDLMRDFLRDLEACFVNPSKG